MSAQQHTRATLRVRLAVTHRGALRPDFKQLQWIPFALSRKQFIWNTSMASGITPNAVDTDDGIPVVFREMATESLGDAADVCEQLLGCGLLCVQICCWWAGPGVMVCSTAAAQRQDCFKMELEATGLVENVDDHADPDLSPPRRLVRGRSSLKIGLVLGTGEQFAKGVK